MTQRDLFQQEAPEVRLTLVFEHEEGGPADHITRLEVWSGKSLKPNALLGIITYRNSAHDLLGDDVRHIYDLWQYSTRSELIKWCHRRQRHVSRYSLKHAAAWYQKM